MFKLLASVFGIGYIKGGGTVAAVLCCGLLYLARAADPTGRPWPAGLLTGGLLAGGTWVAQQVEPAWGKDSYRVVIDEVAGMWVGLLLVPITGATLLAGLLLFRFFDMVKPLGIRRLEALPGGLGVMADDVLAGLYTNVLLQVALHLNWL